MLTDEELKELDWELGNPWISRHTGRSIGQKLMKEVELLRAVVDAARGFCNDIEGDGFENMQPRDDVNYANIKRSLQNLDTSDEGDGCDE